MQIPSFSAPGSLKTLLLMTLFCPGYSSAKRVSGAMELAGVSQTGRDPANPVFALFMSPLPPYQLHFKYFRFVPYLHIPLFSFKLSVWHFRYSVIIRTVLHVFLRHFRPTEKGMTFVWSKLNKHLNIALKCIYSLDDNFLFKAKYLLNSILL